MKSALVLCLAVLAFSAVSFASVGTQLKVSGATAKKLRSALIENGVKVRSGIESTTVAAEKLECGSTFLPSKGVIYTCSWIDSDDLRGARSAGAKAKSLHLALVASKAKVLNAIESTMIEVKTLRCNTTFLPEKGVIYSCLIKQE